MGEYDRLLDRVTEARAISHRLDAESRQARKAVIEAEREFVDWLVENGGAPKREIADAAATA